MLTHLQAIWRLPRGCKISILALFLPQLYWFRLMLRGAIKVSYLTFVISGQFNLKLYIKRRKGFLQKQKVRWKQCGIKRSSYQRNRYEAIAIQRQ